MDAAGPRFAFLPPEEPAADPFRLGTDAGPPDPEDAFRDDLFETISDAHYLLPPALESHEDELLESLVEKGCEDNQILDRLSAQLGGAPYADALLADAPGAELLGRLESPSRSAAQGLLHLARRPSAEPAPDPHLLYPARLPDAFRYEDYEDIARSPAPAPEEPRPEEPSGTPVEEPPPATFEPPEAVEPSPPASPISDLRDLKLDILSSEIDIGFQLEPVGVPEIETLSEMRKRPERLSAGVELEPEAAGAALGLAYEEGSPAEEPRDLSMPRRPAPPAEPPRAPSRESDAMQSPQPSGIPAISSPEVFSAPSAKARPSPFLESLYASTSPKMYTSEVTIQQCLPLNLGKHRKSASPTVSSCSEELRPGPGREPGEPPEKRARREPDLNKICNQLKKNSEDKLAEAKQKKRLSEIEQLPPLKQLELLKSNKNFNLPEHMLVPRARLNSIIAAPGREIPALLMERPQLSMPEILQDPNFIGDPELMVISLEQIRQLIIHKPPEGARRGGSVPRALSPRPPSLADEIDAANSAAAYQMNWLPAMYLSRMSQLEAVAACSQNADFLKALGGAGYGGAGYAGLSQMFHPARYGLPAVPAVPPLEFAMWQEAMSAMQRHRRPEPAGREAEAGRARRAPPGAPPAGSPRPRISVKSLQELQHAAQGARRPARRRDEPEVGSTTSAGEAPPPHAPLPAHPPHPHDPAAFSLWHPLFSNQKGYPSPWSWTTVTATGD